ncbi:MAG: M16 family metallopeptidase, partial [Myxococcota bacterium]
CTLYRTWQTPPTGSSDDAALLVAATVLADGRGTRFDRHYYSKDWVLESEVDLWPSDFAGMFVASMTVEGRSLKAVDRLIEREVAGIVRSPPSEAELHRAKSRIRSWAQSALDGPSSRAETLAGCLELHGTPDCVSEEWRAVEAVTSADVSGAMQRVLAGPSVRLSVVPAMETDCALAGSVAVEVP